MANAGTTQFPSAVVDHIYGEALTQWYERFFEEQRLLGVQRDAIDEAVWKVYTREHTLDAFLRVLEEQFGSLERARAIAIPILGNDLLKIEDYLGVNIPAYITHLGGDASLFVEEIPVMEVVRSVMAGIGISSADPVTAKRLEGAITARLSGVRDALETKDVLVRSAKVGGVGLDSVAADRVVGALEEKLRALKQGGVILRKGDGKPPEESTFHLVKPAKSGLMQPEDEEEIERLRNVTPGDPIGERMRAAVDHIIQKTGAKFKNEDVMRRFRAAIESRLRDIRDGQETLDLLTRPSAQGGFGIPEPAAAKVLAVVEEEFRTMHGKSESRRMVAPGASSPLAGIASSLPAPRNDKLVNIPKKDVAPTTPALPSPPPVVTLVHPVPPKPPAPPPPPPKQIPIAPPPAAVPPLRVRGGEGELASEHNPSPPPLTLRGGAQPPPLSPLKPPPPATIPPPPIVKQIPIAPPPPARTQLPPLRVRGGEGELASEYNPSQPPLASRGGGATSPQPMVPSAPSGKPRLQDIRAVPPRLVGPIEELQRFTIHDLRKIAKTPAEATARIAENLARLEKDSYTKRAEGVKALRGSALMIAYAELVNAAFLGKRTVEDCIAERLRASKDAMTLDEFHALMSLNAQLRF